MSQTIIIRNATTADAGTLRRLAILDSRAPITGPAMIAEVDGVPRVALDLHDDTVAADPFAPTAKLVDMLRSPLVSPERNVAPRLHRSRLRALLAA